MIAFTSPQRRSTVPKRRSQGVLSLVMLLLIGSAALRLATEAGQALAEGETPLPKATEVAAVPPEPAATCPSDPELNAILSRLSEREGKLADQSDNLATREVALRAAEARLSQRISELKAAEASLTEAMAKTATAAEDDVSTLVAVYAAMKPKDAATLFEVMAPDFAAGFLRRMRPDSAAPIFAGLSPAQAYAVSAVLAGRNIDVPVPPAPPAAESEKADNG